MSKKMTRLTTTLAASAFLFALTSVAEAGVLRRAPRVEAPAIRLADLAGEWFSNVWAGVTGIFEKDGSPLNPGPATSACTNPNGCGEAGWGIDPNG